MSLDSFHHLDAVAQAELVRRGEVTPSELVDAAIARIEALNPQLNAVIHRCFDEGRAQARQATGSPKPDERLYGVPFLLKDSASGQAGMPMTQGNVALKRINRRLVEDTPLGRRFRDSGLQTVGVTNVPEFGQLGDTQPLAFGATRNPWDRERSASGSSGGAAAAVAAGMVPIAQGGDGAGSIRGPAAWCGLVGLKVSRGRVPRPELDKIDDIFSTELVLSRTVRDTAAVLDAVAGAQPGELCALPSPSSRYYTGLGTPTPRLRIGVLTDALPGLPMHPECLKAVESAGGLLEQAGHRVEASCPEAFFDELPSEIDRIRQSVLFGGAIRGLEKNLGRKVTEEDVEPYTWARFQESAPVSADELRTCLGWHLRRSARMLEWWAGGFDVLVTAPLNEPAPTLSSLVEPPRQMAITERRHARFLEPFNASGQPAISVPLHMTPEGLPVGVQLVGDRGREDLLLGIAAELEQATGWPERWPRHESDLLEEEL